MLSPPPLRTGRDGFRSSGSSGSKLHRSEAGFHNRFCSLLSFRQQEAVFLDKFLAVSLEKHPLLKVIATCRVKGIRIAFDFGMSPDGGRGRTFEMQPDGFSIRRALAGIRCELPSASFAEMPIFLGHPAMGFVWMSSSCPFPQGLPDGFVHLAECALRTDVPVIIGPAPDDGSSASR